MKNLWNSLKFSFSFQGFDIGILLRPSLKKLNTTIVLTTISASVSVFSLLRLGVGELPPRPPPPGLIPPSTDMLGDTDLPGGPPLACTATGRTVKQLVRTKEKIKYTMPNMMSSCLWFLRWPLKRLSTTFNLLLKRREAYSVLVQLP